MDSKNYYLIFRGIRMNSTIFKYYIDEKYEGEWVFVSDTSRTVATLSYRNVTRAVILYDELSETEDKWAVNDVSTGETNIIHTSLSLSRAILEAEKILENHKLGREKRIGLIDEFNKIMNSKGYIKGK